jgi:hypothetical protein
MYVEFQYENDETVGTILKFTSRDGKCTEKGVMVILVFTSTEIGSILLQMRYKYRILMKVMLLLRGILRGYLWFM